MQYLRSPLLIFALAIPQLIYGGASLQQQLYNNEDIRSQALKVYLDGHGLDNNYIRSNITFVNYVRDRKDAQVHILITSQNTASGGHEYTLAFIGQQDFDGENETLTYFSNEEDTKDVVRSGMVQILKLGLTSYVAKTPLAEYLHLSFARKVSPVAVEDRWDSWVFRLSTSPSFRGEESRNSIQINGSLSADRITPELKIRSYLYGTYNENNYIIDGEKTTSITRSQSFSGLIVKSLTEHWSAGASLGAYTSTYRNIQRSISLSPAVEYNLFPYSESTRRELRFTYKISPSDYQYVDTTLYGEIAETLISQSLDISLQITEKWGTMRTSLKGSHYFHDFDFNKLQLSSSLNLRLFKGLSLSLSVTINAVHDQISLPKGDATSDEILLRTRELKTDYGYNGRIGLTYTFGSIYSNVVNSRFGSAGGVPRRMSY